MNSERTMICTPVSKRVLIGRLASGCGAALLMLLITAPANADRRAAARSNLGGARAGAAAARPNVTRPSASPRPTPPRPNATRPSPPSRPSTSPRPTPPRPNATLPNVSRPDLTRNNPSLPNSSIPSLGGRPANNLNLPNRNVQRPGTGTSRPDLGSSGINRPVTGGSRPNPGLNRPGDGSTRPSVQPGLDSIAGNRPGGGLESRPDLSGIGSGRVPNRPGSGDLGSSRPSADRLNDFLQMPRTDRDRPALGGDRPGLGIDRPGLGTERPGLDRPGVDRERPVLDRDRPSLDRDRPSLDRDRPSLDRPSWDQRPDRPIFGDGNWNDRIHDLPDWVNMDRDSLNGIRDRWNDTLWGRGDDLYRSLQLYPNRVARWRSWGNNVRFRWQIGGVGVFGPSWWTAHHPMLGRWHHWHHWNRHPWRFWWARSTFPVLTRWFVWRAPPIVWTQPIFYDFGPGGNVILSDNRVFISGVDIGSSQEFAQSAAELATVPPPQDDAELDATEWLPIGTFAVSTSELEGEPSRFVQLAVNQQGIVSGTFFNSQTEVSQAVLGQVDPETQRVAVRLGEDEDLVIETGLYNLTLDEVPVMVHFADEATEFFLLVRMEEPEADFEE